MEGGGGGRNDHALKENLWGRVKKLPKEMFIWVNLPYGVKQMFNIKLFINFCVLVSFKQKPKH